jgi:hypothetical protein
MTLARAGRDNDLELDIQEPAKEEGACGQF